MTLTVATSAGSVKIREFHQECVTVLGREVGGNLSGREEAWKAVLLKSPTLMAWLTAERDNYTWRPHGGRVMTQIGLLQAGTPIDAPVMYAERDTLDSILIWDGRHRITALHELGATFIPVMVPESQVELFVTEFG